MLGTKEKGKKSSPKNLEKKFQGTLRDVEPSHWLHEIFISKTIHHHFWLGLIPPL
jgi:hypothetical protein